MAVDTSTTDDRHNIAAQSQGQTLGSWAPWPGAGHHHGGAGGRRAVRAGLLLRVALLPARQGRPRRWQPAILASPHARASAAPLPAQLASGPAQQVLQ